MSSASPAATRRPSPPRRRTSTRGRTTRPASPPIRRRTRTPRCGACSRIRGRGCRGRRLGGWACSWSDSRERFVSAPHKKDARGVFAGAVPAAAVDGSFFLLLLLVVLLALAFFLFVLLVFRLVGRLVASDRGFAFRRRGGGRSGRGFGG